MSFIAPNLCALIGSDISARLMGLAGGLKKLSEIPACNIMVNLWKTIIKAGMIFEDCI